MQRSGSGSKSLGSSSGSLLGEPASDLSAHASCTGSAANSSRNVVDVGALTGLARSRSTGMSCSGGNSLQLPPQLLRWDTTSSSRTRLSAAGTDAAGLQPPQQLPGRSYSSGSGRPPVAPIAGSSSSSKRGGSWRNHKPTPLTHLHPLHNSLPPEALAGSAVPEPGQPAALVTMYNNADWDACGPLSCPAAVLCSTPWEDTPVTAAGRYSCSGRSTSSSTSSPTASSTSSGDSSMWLAVDNALDTECNGTAAAAATTPAAVAATAASTVAAGGSDYFEHECAMDNKYILPVSGSLGCNDADTASTYSCSISVSSAAASNSSSNSSTNSSGSYAEAACNQRRVKGTVAGQVEALEVLCRGDRACRPASGDGVETRAASQRNSCYSSGPVQVAPAAAGAAATTGRAEGADCISSGTVSRRFDALVSPVTVAGLCVVRLLAHCLFLLLIKHTRDWWYSSNHFKHMQWW